MSSSDGIEVQIDKPRAASEVLTASVVDSRGEVFTVDKEYFWSVAPGELYDVYSEPGKLGIGKLSESGNI